MFRKLLIPFLALAFAGFALAACGGGDDTSSTPATTPTTADTTSSGGSGATVDFEASPDSIAYTQTDVSAPAGSDTISFNNPASIPHDVVIEDADGNQVAQTDTITDSTTETTADLQAGTYTFYCSVDGHREQGMEGTLTVK